MDNSLATFSGFKNNFKRYGRGTIDSLKTPYDYGSVMHYRSTAFSKNRKPTIVPKRRGVRCYCFSFSRSGSFILMHFSFTWAVNINLLQRMISSKVWVFVYLIAWGRVELRINFHAYFYLSFIYVFATQWACPQNKSTRSWTIQHKSSSTFAQRTEWRKAITYIL